MCVTGPCANAQAHCFKLIVYLIEFFFNNYVFLKYLV